MNKMTSETAQQAGEQNSGSVVTLGMFDGVHRGHREIVGRARSLADRLNLVCRAVTFDRHPQVVLGGSPPPLLTSLGDKIRLLIEAGAHRVELLSFGIDLARMLPEDFVRQIVVGRYHARTVVVGYNYTFGRNAAGNAELLKKLLPGMGVGLEVVAPVRHKGGVVSSTRIRESLLAGDVELASELLGRPYELSGRVVPGRGHGHRLGFPTANLEIESNRCLPKDGVYVVRTSWEPGVALDGVMCVGAPVTFGERRRVVEVHIFELHADLYGRRLRVSVLKRLRDMIHFRGPEQLRQQLQRDVETAKSWLTQHVYTRSPVCYNKIKTSG